MGIKRYTEFISEQIDKKHHIKMSRYTRDDIEDRWGYHRSMDKNGSVETVNHNDVRATQSTIDDRWSPSRKKKAEWHSTEPVGVRYKGKVHLIDGHHRVNDAISKGKPQSKIRVFDHDEHEKNYQKYKKRNED